MDNGKLIKQMVLEIMVGQGGNYPSSPPGSALTCYMCKL